MKKIIFRLGQMLCLLSFGFMLSQSSLVLKYAREGLINWAVCVLPLLLPFIILSKFWIRYGIPELFFSQFRRIFPGHTKLAVTLPVFLLGLCSGFPVGAIFISHYYQNGVLSRKQAELLLPLASFVSPMFVMGYVRSQINLQGKAWLYYICALYFPVFLCFFLMQISKKSKRHKKMSSSIYILSRKSPSKSETASTDTPFFKLSLTKAVWAPSLEIIFIIGIYMMIFSVLSGMLTQLSLFKNTACTFLLANLEVTTGIHLLAADGLLYSQKMLCALTAATTSFGGLCTMAQVQTVISPTDLSLKPYVEMKLLTSCLTFLLCLLLF